MSAIHDVCVQIWYYVFPTSPNNRITLKKEKKRKKNNTYWCVIFIGKHDTVLFPITIILLSIDYNTIVVLLISCFITILRACHATISYQISHSSSIIVAFLFIILHLVRSEDDSRIPCVL